MNSRTCFFKIHDARFGSRSQRASVIDTSSSSCSSSCVSVGDPIAQTVCCVDEYQSFEPPSTRKASPVIQRASSEARKVIAAAMSSGAAIRLSAWMPSVKSRPDSATVAARESMELTPVRYYWNVWVADGRYLEISDGLPITLAWDEI
jgi:hypothetical protein